MPGKPLVDHLKGMRLLCPFAVSPHHYDIEHELPINIFCWFIAEKNCSRIASDPVAQLTSGCGMAGVYTKCGVYRSIAEV